MSAQNLMKAGHVSSVIIIVYYLPIETRNVMDPRIQFHYVE